MSTEKERLLTESYLVFSDVHLGSDLDDCQGNAPQRSSAVDRDLVALVAHYRKVPPRGDRWHIVIAGDFIDFIGMTIRAEALDPQLTELTEEEHAHGLGGAADHACEKLRRVTLRHRDIFAALAGFLIDGHALTLVHGNHDIELHWDDVKAEFRRALLEHAVVAAPDLDSDAFLARIAFDPWFFWRDGVAFIEHGHQYDEFCATACVMTPLSPLDPRRIARGFCETLLRFVVRPTRGMTESGHEHVGLTHYLQFGWNLGFGGAVALGLRFVRAVRELFRLRAASFSAAARELQRKHDARLAELAAAKRIGVDRLRALLALQAKPLTSSVRGILASVLLDRLALAFAALFAIGASVVAGHAWVSLVVVAVWVGAHLLLARARSVDPSRQLADRAAHLASLFPAAFVVMGHTHVPHTVRAGAATYINIGSWAEHEDGSEVATRTHLVIHPTPNGTEANFCRWSEAGPEKL